MRAPLRFCASKLIETAGFFTRSKLNWNGKEAEFDRVKTLAHELAESTPRSLVETPSPEWQILLLELNSILKLFKIARDHSHFVTWGQEDPSAICDTCD